MGADVIKVEPPGSGDSSRRRSMGDDTAAFLAVNRNKRTVALDLKDERAPRGVPPARATADVLIENYRPGVSRAAGRRLRDADASNPRLIYASDLRLRPDRPVRRARRAST